MAHFDKKVPSSLKNLQKWFGTVIATPLNEKGELNFSKNSANDNKISSLISPSPTLSPMERIQIYNQQYWWRLLTAMQEAYPLITRLFGYNKFNTLIAIPFLTAYPADHWSLFTLGSKLPLWIKKKYQRKDKELVLAAASLENAFNAAFIARHSSFDTTIAGPSKEAAAQMLLEAPIALQQHLAIFCWEQDLISFRTELLRQPVEYWQENDLPAIKQQGPYCYVVYRDLETDMAWEQLSLAEYSVLELFTRHQSIAAVCTVLEKKPFEKKQQETITANLSTWISKWMVKQWLGPNILNPVPE